MLVRGKSSLVRVVKKFHASQSNLYLSLIQCRKTTLLKQVAKPVAESNGFMITCNFDRTVSPDTVLASALNNFFGESLTCVNTEVTGSMRSRIRATLGEHVR
jgi:hypothetical protein